MSAKDESIFSKEALMSTQTGKDILRQGLLRSKGFKQFNQYKEKTEREFGGFANRFASSLQKLIESDNSPARTMDEFADQVGTTQLTPSPDKYSMLKSRLSTHDLLHDRVMRILNSNFVKMTYPVFHALYDASEQYFGDSTSEEKKNAVVDGHIIAIDLSEPMDRIVDQDEDLEYLEEYKYMCPYILVLARQKIAQGGDDVLDAFEDGFKDARLGQNIDVKMKLKPASISDEKMTDCYKKYRAVMGTAGRNMALNRRPLSDIYYLGMAKAAECVGCGNEIEDAIKNQAVKVPSWPLYFALNTGNVKRGFELSMEKAELYLKEAQLAVEMLDEHYQFKPFLEFLFLTVRHYNQYWYNQLQKLSLYESFQKTLDSYVTINSGIKR